MNRIKELRTAKGVTLDEMQEQTGINRVTISQYERGKREPKLATWKKLADYFDVSIPYIQGIELSDEEVREQIFNLILSKYNQHETYHDSTTDKDIQIYDMNEFHKLVNTFLSSEDDAPKNSNNYSLTYSKISQIINTVLLEYHLQTNFKPITYNNLDDDLLLSLINTRLKSTINGERKFYSRNEFTLDSLKIHIEDLENALKSKEISINNNNWSQSDEDGLKSAILSLQKMSKKVFEDLLN